MKNFELAQKRMLELYPDAVVTWNGGVFRIYSPDNKIFLSGFFAEPNQCWLNAFEQLLPHLQFPYANILETSDLTREWEELEKEWNELSSAATEVLAEKINPASTEISPARKKFYMLCTPKKIETLIEKIRGLIDDNNYVWDYRQATCEENNDLKDKLEAATNLLNCYYEEKALADTLKNIGDGDCHICKQKTHGLAGNPSAWPIWLPFKGGNGKSRVYHMSCVVRGLEKAEETQQENTDGKEE